MNRKRLPWPVGALLVLMLLVIWDFAAGHQPLAKWTPRLPRAIAAEESKKRDGSVVVNSIGPA